MAFSRGRGRHSATQRVSSRCVREMVEGVGPKLRLRAVSGRGQYGPRIQDQEKDQDGEGDGGKFPRPLPGVRNELGPARNAQRVATRETAALGRVEIHTQAHTRANKQAFAQKQGLDRGKLRFLFDGTRIDENATAQELELENDDMIDAFLHQVGGAAV